MLDATATASQKRAMQLQVALDRLSAHVPELRALGIDRLALFGSTARGEAGPASDVDLAVRLDPERRIGLFGFASIQARLTELLEAPVDLVSEPARRPSIQAAIDRDRVDVF